MSYTSGFFDAIDQGGGNYDRVYDAANFAHYFSLLIQNGVFPNPSTGMQVKASTNPDMHVTVQPGDGWINGYYISIENNNPEQLTIPTANPSLSRFDSVIMGLNYVDRKIEIYVKSGAVSANPSPVTLQRDNDLYEMELAQIRVSAGSASISQSNIHDMRSNTARCGIVKGTVDQIDTTDLFAQYDDAFQTWFSNIQSQLSGDVAANLQNQINGKAPISHASSNTTYGVATSSLYGHVKLSNATNSSFDETSGIAATPYAVKTVFNLAKGKAPMTHASSATTYGTGSSTKYGHVLLSDEITSTSDTSSGTAATPNAVYRVFNNTNILMSLLNGMEIQCGWEELEYTNTNISRTRIDFTDTFSVTPTVIVGQVFDNVNCTVYSNEVDTEGFYVTVPKVGNSSIAKRKFPWVAIGEAKAITDWDGG